MIPCGKCGREINPQRPCKGPSERCPTHFSSSIECVAATTCDEATLQTVVQNNTACCEGFSTRSRYDEDFQLVYYYGLREMLGCPVGTYTTNPF